MDWLQKIPQDQIIIAGIVFAVIVVIIVYSISSRKKSSHVTKKNTVTQQPMKNAQTPFVLYNFYTNWCGHSQRLMPVWANVEKHLANDQSVTVMALDCDIDENNNMAQIFGVKGYPTIILQTPTENFMYDGPRTVEDIIKFYNNTKSVA